MVNQKALRSTLLALSFVCGAAHGFNAGADDSYTYVRFRNQGECVDEKGAHGLNKDYLGACGDLSHEDLRFKDYSFLKLPRSNFFHTNFEGTRFIQADLWKTSFMLAKLSWVDFRQAYLYGANLYGANVENADFQFADFRHADLRNIKNGNKADFRNAVYDTLTRFPESWNCPRLGECLEAKNRGMQFLWLSQSSLIPRQENRKIVEACLENTPMYAGVQVYGQTRSLGRKTPWYEQDLYYGTKYAYSLFKEPDGIHIRMKIRFRAWPKKTTKQRALQMLSRTRACIPQLQELWGRYGLIFEPSFDSAYDRLPMEPSLYVNLIDGPGRSNSGNFYVDFTRSLSSYCKILAHELGHLLSLPDEYSDSDAPDRQGISSRQRPWSVMDEHYRPWQDIEFFPEHIKQVLKPLCELEN